MKKQTLLEKAKEVKIERKISKIIITDEHIELAIAWAKDEIQLSQVSTVLFGEKSVGKIGGRTLYWLASALREGIRTGKIK